MSNENLYTKIVDQESLDKFLESVYYFEDSLLRELSVVSRGFVAKDGGMFGDIAPIDARWIVQMQENNTPCIEVIFENVELIRIDSNSAVVSGGKFEKGTLTITGTVTNDKIVLYASGFDEGKINLRIVAESMKYRILGKEYWGHKLITVKEISRQKNEAEKDWEEENERL